MALEAPSIDELIDAFFAPVKGQLDNRTDDHSGATLELIAGTAAVIWSRQGQRDTDLFKTAFLMSSEGEELTEHLLERYEYERVVESFGTGYVRMHRPTTNEGEGTFWKGTRILVIPGDRNPPVEYLVANDFVVGADKTIVDVPIRAKQPGPKSAVDTQTSGMLIQLPDPVWEPDWDPRFLTCSAGTLFEPANIAVENARKQYAVTRNGYEAGIITAIKAAGASVVVLFPSDYAGSSLDHGINAIYVGDAGFTTSEDLFIACLFALDGCAVAGTAMTPRPMRRSVLDISATVALWDSPTLFNISELRLILTGVLRDYFGGASRGFTYDRGSMAGAMIAASSAVQSVTFTAPSSDVPLLTNGNFPLFLTRYVPGNITLTFTGPEQ